ncbi:MAG: YaiO family outer membrane beta-barrel protein [Balneolia bacterium]|nr:YaiO family outer membrane beta-barrel protein [Balneolia bacterium]
MNDNSFDAHSHSMHILPAFFLLTFLISLFSFPAYSQSESFPKWTAGISQQVDFFSDFYDEQYITQFSLISEFSRSTWIAHVNQGYRFEQWGTQLELEAYPQLGDGIYALINYAYSPDDIFPEHRAGFELFASVPPRSEVSLGFRYLDFRGNAQSLIFTGALTHYWNSYMFTLRPYYTMTDLGDGQTLTLLARRFFNLERSYIQLFGGFGTTTEDIILQLVDGAFQEDVLLLKSQQLLLSGRFHLSNRWYLTAETGLIRQELGFDPDNYVNNYRVKAGFYFRF